MTGFTLIFVAALTGGALYLLAQTWDYKKPGIAKQVQDQLQSRLDHAGDDEALRSKAYNAYSRSQRWWKVLRVSSYIFTVCIGLWVGLLLRSDTPQADWDAYDEYTAGFNDSWGTVCEVIFSYSSNGTLYYDGRGYNESWCNGLNQERYLFDWIDGVVPRFQANAEAADYRDTGSKTGGLTAVKTVFAAVPELCDTNGCVTEDRIFDVFSNPY